MKDKVARDLIDDIAAKMGCHVESHFSLFSIELNDSVAGDRFRGLENRIRFLERRIKDMTEDAKPTCKSCGQKIQEGGLRAGQVEAVAEAVSGKRTKR